MPLPLKTLKAELHAITWDDKQVVKELGLVVPVQFNPESLKLSFSNQNAGGDQRGGAAKQFVAKGNTKLSFDVWFDVTAPGPDASTEQDVRRLTDKVVYFMRPSEALKGAPPGVRFLWGSFLFEGVVESVNETLEYFSEDGRPLRASVAVGLAKQDIVFQFGKQGGAGLGAALAPGGRPTEAARAGDSVQKIAARGGRPADWQRIAARNGIENPRSLPAGTRLDVGS